MNRHTLSTVRLTKAEITHLLGHLAANDESEEPWYYGDKHQFEIRHNKLIDMLTDISNEYE